jgi:hypothetical protein
MSVYGIPSWQLIVAGALLLTVGTAGVAYLSYRRLRVGLDDQFDQLIAEEDEVTLKPPDTHNTPLDYLRVMRHFQRARKLAKKGYVKWYRVGSTMSRPTWVKPTLEGQGLPKHENDDGPYYFPKEAMVSDELTGAWVAMHREGEADPINLREPAYPGIETDLVERTINLEAEDKPPGLLDKLSMGGLSTQAMIYGGMALLFLVYAGYAWYTGMI